MCAGDDGDDESDGEEEDDDDADSEEDVVPHLAVSTEVNDPNMAAIAAFLLSGLQHTRLMLASAQR
jgi:hypothetical protein